jgi:hypothetical protein
MGLAKRIAAMVEDGRLTEEKADLWLEKINAAREGHDLDGQELLSLKENVQNDENHS